MDNTEIESSIWQQTLLVKEKQIPYRIQQYKMYQLQAARSISSFSDSGIK